MLKHNHHTVCLDSLADALPATLILGVFLGRQSDLVEFGAIFQQHVNQLRISYAYVVLGHQFASPRYTAHRMHHTLLSSAAFFGTCVQGFSERQSHSTRVATRAQPSAPSRNGFTPSGTV
jgi:hypothetical protein